MLLGVLLDSVLGLSFLPRQIADAILAPRDHVANFLRSLVSWFARLAARVLPGAGGSDLTRHVTGQGEGRTASVWLKKTGGGVSVRVVASPEMNLGQQLAAWRQVRPNDRRFQGKVAQAQSLYNSALSAGTDVQRLLDAVPAAPGPAAGPGGRRTMLNRGRLDRAMDEALAALTQFAPITAQLEAEAGGCSIGGGMCFGTGTLLDGRPIEEITCGRKLRTYAPASDHVADESAWDATSLRPFRLDLDHGDGNGVQASLLRPADLQSAAVGGSARLDLPEMGAVGWARVTAVEPCPPLD